MTPQPTSGSFRLRVGARLAVTIGLVFAVSLAAPLASAEDTSASPTDSAAVSTTIEAPASVDVDHDGVLDDVDSCLETPADTTVDENGCTVVAESTSVDPTTQASESAADSTTEESASADPTTEESASADTTSADPTTEDLASADPTTEESAQVDPPSEEPAPADSAPAPVQRQAIAPLVAAALPTVTLTQGSGCISYDVTVTGDIPADATVSTSILYGDPGNPFTVPDQNIGPGIVSGQSFHVSIALSSLDPAGIDSLNYPAVRAVAYYIQGTEYSYAEITLDRSCRPLTPVVTPVTPTAPTFVDNHDGTGTVTVVAQDGVQFQINGNNVAPGTYPVSGSGNVSAVAADSSHVLVGDTTWTYNFTPVVTPVTPTAPTFVDNHDGTGTVTVVAQDGVQFQINGNNVAPGTYPVSGSGNVSAVAADSSHVLVGDTTWTFNFVASPSTPPTSPSPSTPPTTAPSSSPATSPSATTPPATSPAATTPPATTPVVTPPPATTPPATGPVVVPVPQTPEVNDPPGPGNATWAHQSDTDSVIWTLRDDGTLAASVTENHIFADGTSCVEFGVAKDSEGSAPVDSKSSQTDDSNPVPSHVGTGEDDTSMISTNGLQLLQSAIIALLVALAVYSGVAYVRRRPEVQ